MVDAGGVRLCQRGCAGGEGSQLEDKGGKVEWLLKPNATKRGIKNNGSIELPLVCGH